MPSRHWNTGPVYMLSNACTPKLRKTISRQHAHLYVVLYCFLRATTYELCITSGRSRIIGGRPPPCPLDVRHLTVLNRQLISSYFFNSQVGVFVSRTWRKNHGLLVGLTVAGFHLLFLLYLHFAYHSVYHGMMIS